MQAAGPGSILAGRVLGGRQEGNKTDEECKEAGKVTVIGQARRVQGGRETPWAQEKKLGGRKDARGQKGCLSGTIGERIGKAAEGQPILLSVGQAGV